MSSVAAGSRPVAVVTDGSSVFVADAGSGSVTAYDGAKLTTTWSVTVGTRAENDEFLAVLTEIVQ